MTGIFKRLVSRNFKVAKIQFAVTTHLNFAEGFRCCPSAGLVVNYSSTLAHVSGERLLFNWR